MMVPTKPGAYWLLRGLHGALIECVFMSTPQNRPSNNGVPDDGPSFLAVNDEYGNGSFAVPVEKFAASGPYEFGERIPDNDTLKAMRELASREPVVTYHIECDYDFGGSDLEVDLCGYCGKVPHKPHCPWLRAQEKEE